MSIHWHPTDLNLGRYTPRGTRILDTGVVVTGGYLRGPSDGILERVGVLLRIAPELARQTWEGPGWVQGIGASGRAVHAVAATLSPSGSGSDYRLLVSADEGQTWREAGPIPAESVTQVCSAGPDEIWVLGADTLLRSGDGGGSWAAVEPPYRINSTRDRLQAEGGAVLLLGYGVNATSDGGRTWREYPMDQGQVAAVAGSLVALQAPGQVILGSMSEQGMQWLTVFDKEMRPCRLVLHGDTVDFLAVPLGDREVGRGLLHYRSPDRGVSWEAQLVHCRADEGAADLGPGRGLAVDPEGRVLVGS